MQDSRIAVILYLTALVPRLFLWSLIVARPEIAHFPDDSAGYLTIAQNLAQHWVFSADADAPPRPDIVKAPGYPLFLAVAGWLTGFREPGVLFLQVLVTALIAPCVFKLGLTLGFKRKTAVLAGFLSGLEPALLSFSAVFMSEAVFTVALAWAVLLWARTVRQDQADLKFFTSGLAWFCAAFIRPVTLYLPVVTIPFMLWRFWRQGAAKALLWCGIYLAGGILPIAAWTVRNYQATGNLSFSFVSTYNLYFYRASLVQAKATGESLDALREEGLDELKAGGWPGLQRRAIRILLDHPRETATLTFVGALKVIFSPETYLWTRLLDLPSGGTGFFVWLEWGAGSPIRASEERTPFFLVATLTFIVLVLYGCALRAYWVSHDRASFWILASLSLYFVLLSAGGESLGRYRIPIIPFVSLLACAGLERSNRSSPRAPCLIA
jgi:4-amino-4-deoxy-L-arabinose transferase-like glycosyltransferase